MKLSALSSLSVLSLMIGTLTLAGCGGAFSMPDSVVSSSSAASGPPISGSVYGGHAPVQGAHVYLLQPSITAYGGVATSILGNNGATSANGYTISTDTADPNVPVGSKYVTSDATGQFSLTGAYTCQVGQPVYIYAYGGNIGATTGIPVVNTITITNTSTAYNVANSPNAYTQTFTYTATGSPAAPTVGETVNLNLTNTASTGGYGWNNLTSVVVASVNAAAGQFTGQPDATQTFFSGSGTGTYSSTSAPATNNSSIVQLLTLGNCPSSGNFSTAGNGALNYVYVNEVSTVAAAYTFQPFTLSSNNDAFHIGSTGGTQALLGIANAANTAAQLYNIQGNGTISTSGDGEGHLANTLTAGTNGIIPQANIDTLANILANCVDSVPSNTGNVTSQCSSLFNIATDDGTTSTTTGNVPVDTATAAINIARYPAGNHSTGTADATYVSDLYSLQTGTVPYVPDLNSAPNDWTIAINYPYSSSAYGLVSNLQFGKAESLAIDASGNIWVTGQVKDSIVRLNNLGVISPSTAEQTFPYIPGYVSLDGSNNAYTGSANYTTSIFEAGSNGVFQTTLGSPIYNSSYVNIADNAGDDYFFASTSATAGNFEMFEFPSGSSSSTTPNMYSISPSIFNAGKNVDHGAIDASGDFWLTSEGSYQIARVTKTGTSVFTLTGVAQPEYPSIDAAGNGWVPNYQAASIYKITSTGTSTTLTSSSTGAGLVYPFGSAIDGNGNAWITNRCGPANNCGTYTYGSTLVELNGSNNKAISPSTNYMPQAQYPATAKSLTAVMPDPLNVAIDPSGNVWITNYTNSNTNGALTEIVGAAAPVVTPLSAAASGNKLGQKPN
jgi:hypothetical protein